MGIQKPKTTAKSKFAEKRSRRTRALKSSFTGGEVPAGKGFRMLTLLTRSARRAAHKAVSDTSAPVTSGAVERADDEFSVLTKEIATRFGVRVAPVAQPKKNTYAMSADKAVEYAKKAGILTEAGNLRRPFK